MAECLKNIGDAYYYLDEFEDYINNYKKAIEVNPNEKFVIECLEDLVESYISLEKYDDAIKEYNKIIELCVDNLEKSEALIEIGLIYYKKLDYIQAFLKFDEAKQLNNNLDVTTIDFDNELIDRNLAEELGQFNKIFELNIDSELIALAHIEIGRILKSEGDFTKAENHYGEAIRINPNSSLEALALIELGNIFLEQKNDGLAIEKYISAKKINHN